MDDRTAQMIADMFAFSLCALVVDACAEAGVDITRRNMDTALAALLKEHRGAGFDAFSELVADKVRLFSNAVSALKTTAR